MKIPFDIKFRPQIESGKYKVQTSDGKDVRIICWDAKNSYPIVCLNECGIPRTFTKDGLPYHHNDSCLVIVTPKPELTEFEKYVDIIVDNAFCETIQGGIKTISDKLLTLAKKELCKGCSKCFEEYWRGRKEATEEISKGYHYEMPTYNPCPYGEKCTKLFRDCINCYIRSIGISTTTGTTGMLSATDGKPHNPSFIE